MAKQAKRQLAGSGEALPAGAVGEKLRATGNNAVSASAAVRGVGTLSIPSAGVWLISAYANIAWFQATGGCSCLLGSVNNTSNTFPEIGGAAGGLNDIGASLSVAGGNTSVVTFPNLVANFTAAGTVYLNVYTVNNVGAGSSAWSITAVRIA